MFRNISTFERISILPQDSLIADVEIVILVITRWNDVGSRMNLRNTLGSHQYNCEIFHGFSFKFLNSFITNWANFYDINLLRE